jgi:hypothetical protein
MWIFKDFASTRFPADVLWGIAFWFGGVVSGNLHQPSNLAFWLSAFVMVWLLLHCLLIFVTHVWRRLESNQKSKR